MRTKIKKTLDDDRNNREDENDPIVEFRVPPKFEMETDEEVLKR